MKTWRNLTAIVAHVAWLALAGCGGGGGASSQSDTSSSPPAPAQSGSATVGGSQQTAAVTVTGVEGTQLVVPPGALDVPVTVRIAADSSGAPALPQGLKLNGPILALTPHGSQFAKPVEVRIPKPSAALQSGQQYMIAKASVGGSWVLLGNTREEGGMLVAQIDSFSYVAPAVGPAAASGSSWQASLALDCGGQDCSALSGPVADVTATVSVTGSGDPLACPVSGGSFILLSRFGSNGVVGTVPLGVDTLPITGGSITHRWTQYPADFAVGAYRIALRCPARAWDTDLGIHTVFNWRPLLRIEAFPSSVGVPDVAAGSSSTAYAILTGGANPGVEGGSPGFRYPAVPSEGNTATVDWERSDDDGASWRFVATSYQYLANSTPYGNEAPPWRYWRVEHRFGTEGNHSGRIQFRVRACVDAKVQASNGAITTERRCQTSAAASANVLAQAAPPTFTILPRAQLVLNGQTANFSAAATGLPAPTLRWQTRAANSNGAWSDVNTGLGATTGQFTTAVLTLADNGTQYRVVATSGNQSEASPPVTVSVSDTPVAPQITADLFAIRALKGGDASFGIGVRGTEPLSYQWRLNGTPVVGQNAPVLNLQSVQSGATVSVMVSNGAGSVVSREVSLTVTDGALAEAPVVFTELLSAHSVSTGQTAVLLVRATGGGTLHYRWRYNGQDIAGAPDSPVLTLPNASPAMDGRYQVIVSNAVSSATSYELNVRIDPAPPPVALGIDVQPLGLSLNPGQTATFAVAAHGTGTLRYQWYREGVAIAGATTPVLTLNVVSAADAGNYTVQVADQNGTLTSNTAALVVVPAPGTPIFVTQYFQVSAVIGDTPRIEMIADAVPAPRCVWLKNGALLPGATDCTGLTLPAVTAADHGSVYTSIAYNEAGVAIGGPAVLSVFAPAAPVIVEQPVDVSITLGGQAFFYAAATAQPAADGQWSINGTPLPFGFAVSFNAGGCTGAYSVNGPASGQQLALFQLSAQCDGAQVVFTATNRLGTARSRTAILSFTPPVPTGALTATQLVAGYEWSMVLRPDRTVWGWGGFHKMDGTVVVANLPPGDRAQRPVQLYPGALSDVRQIAGWYDGFWALKGEPGSAASRVLHWGNARSANDGRGSDGAGNLGPVPQMRINAAPVEMLERRVVNGALQAAPVDRVCSVAATSDRVLMIRALDGFGTPTDCAAGSAKTVWVAGTLTGYTIESVGVVVPVQGLPAGVPAKVIAAQHTAQSSAGPVLVLMEDGRLYGWGTNIGNQFGLAVPAYTGYVGSNGAPQELPAAWGTASNAAFSYVGLIVQRTDGSAVVSGRNDSGELGLGPQPAFTANDGPLPLPASAGVALDGVQALASTQVQVSLALRQGRILAWGAANQPLQGGNATALPYPRLLPASGDGWRAISAGNAHAMVIAANGAVYTWGSGLRGALGDDVDGGSALAPTLVTVR